MVQIISYTYPQSPYAFKAHSILALAGVNYSNVEVSRVMPRPELAAIGVNYRRIPVVAVGKDVYCDTQAIIDSLGKDLKAKLPAGTSSMLVPMKVLGDTIFRTAIVCVPKQALTPEFVKDRKSVFKILDDPELLSGDLRNHGLSQLRSLFEQLESSLFAEGGSWLAGAQQPTLLDAHIAWSIRWSLQQIGVGQEPGFTKADLPNTWKWLERFLDTVKVNYSTLSGDEAAKVILEAESKDYSTEPSIDNEPTEFKRGDEVDVNQTDADSTHPVSGILIYLGVNEIVIEAETGVKVHFPRLGQKISAKK